MEEDCSKTKVRYQLPDGKTKPHEGRDDSRAKSSKLDAVLMDATDRETLDTWFRKMRQLVGESRSEKWAWAEGHPT